MMAKKSSVPQKLQPWIEARKKHHLSHAQVQMARELGMNPKKLGKIANHKQELWKEPLPQFIEHCYEKRFKKKLPDDIHSIEDKVKEKEAKRKEKPSTEAQTTEDKYHDEKKRERNPLKEPQSLL